MIVHALGYVQGLFVSRSPTLCTLLARRPSDVGTWSTGGSAAWECQTDPAEKGPELTQKEQQDAETVCGARLSY